MSNEKFCLRWNDFENNISSAFRELRDDKNFFDVTLACDDEQIQAHKVILSACSPFFRNILRRNVHQHPLLYLKGVKYTDLQSVLNFMYHGEVNIVQEDLNAFLAVAEDLRVKGLTQSSSGDMGSKPSTNNSQPTPVKPHKTATKLQTISLNRTHSDTTAVDDDIQEVVQLPIKSEPKETQIAPSHTTTPAYTTNHPVAVEQYEEEGDMYEEYEEFGRDTSIPLHEYQAAQDTGKGTVEDVLLSHINKLQTETGWKYCCTLCGKENVYKANVVKHVESVHFPNLVSYKCKFCEKEFSARNSLYTHISRHHKN